MNSKIDNTGKGVVNKMDPKTQKPAGAGSSVCFVVEALLYIFQYNFSHSQKEYIIGRPQSQGESKLLFS